MSAVFVGKGEGVNLLELHGHWFTNSTFCRFICRNVYLHYVYGAKLSNSLSTIPSTIEYGTKILIRTPSHNLWLQDFMAVSSQGHWTLSNIAVSHWPTVWRLNIILILLFLKLPFKLLLNSVIHTSHCARWSQFVVKMILFGRKCND